MLSVPVSFLFAIVLFSTLSRISRRRTRDVCDGNGVNVLSKLRDEHPCYLIRLITGKRVKRGSTANNVTSPRALQRGRLPLRKTKTYSCKRRSYPTGEQRHLPFWQRTSSRSPSLEAKMHTARRPSVVHRPRSAPPPKSESMEQALDTLSEQGRDLHQHWTRREFL